jgi:hypothetical protein
MHQNFTGFDCKKDCVPDCICPEGKFIDLGRNSTCAAADECTCNYRGQFFQKGEKVTVECNEW